MTASSGIGVQQILPRTGTAWQAPSPPQPQNDQSDPAGGASDKPERGATAPGTGNIIDKVA